MANRSWRKRQDGAAICAGASDPGIWAGGVSAPVDEPVAALYISTVPFVF